MGFKNWTPKIAALTVIGFVITILFIKGIVAAWEHSFRPAMWYLAAGVALTVIFFRHRRIAFAIIVLSILLVNVGITALFHPTGIGLLITFASALGLYALAVWGAKKYPHFTKKDWKMLFDQDPR